MLLCPHTKSCASRFQVGVAASQHIHVWQGSLYASVCLHGPTPRDVEVVLFVYVRSPGLPGEVYRSRNSEFAGPSGSGFLCTVVVRLFK